MKSVWLFFLGVAGLVWFSACHRCQEESDECPGDTICTEVFVSISVPIVFSNLSVDDLSRSTTELKYSGKQLTQYDYQKPFDMGPYYAPIVNDSHLPLLKKSGSEILLKIYDISGKKIYEAEYTIGHDCCHVLKINGPDNINL